MITDIDQIEKNVCWTLFEGDHMLQKENTTHYKSVGVSALKSIFAALNMSKIESPTSILDFGCGSGRVTRWLRAAFATADLCVADVREDSLEFCADTFSATSWRSSADISNLNPSRQYDLIWCGSVLTHLSAENSRALLGKFSEWITPNGIAVFTTHGNKVVRNLLTQKLNYVPAKTHPKLLSDLIKSGYGYVPFENQPVGFSISTTAWVLGCLSELDLRVIFLSEGAWDNHQDVFGFCRE
jgi:SAM-dependent methyltransferase